MKRAYADTPEGQIHYVTAGAGPTILLLHHTPRSWTFYRRVIPILATGHRVIAMDTLGFGNSDDWPPAPPGAAYYAQNVIHFLDAIGVKEPVSVCGCNTGSRIATELGIRYPDRVHKMVLWGYPMMRPGKELDDRMEVLKREALGTPLRDGSHILTRFAFITQGLLRRKGATSMEGLQLGDAELEYLEDWMRDSLRAGSHWWQTAVTVYSEDASKRLPLIKVPTLILGHDNAMPQYSIQRSQEVASLIPGGKFLRMEGDANGITYFQPEEIARVIRSFVD